MGGGRTLSLAGALAYAELGAMMPHTGGEYVYMREAYGRLWAFLFGWMRFFIGSGGGNAALAAGLAIFINVLTGGLLGAHDFRLPLAGGFELHLGALEAVAVTAIVLVTAANCAEVARKASSRLVLSTLKVLLIVGLGISAFLFGHGDWSHFAQSGASGTCEGVSEAARGGLAGFGAAMMAAKWAYNGWNELTYVSGEIADPKRNIPRALVAGIGIVGLLYVFVNTSYFFVLPPTVIASLGASSRPPQQPRPPSSVSTRDGSWRPCWRCRSPARSSSRTLCPRGFRTPWRLTGCSFGASPTCLSAPVCRFGR